MKTRDETYRWLDSIKKIVEYAENKNNISDQELLEEIEIANLYRNRLDNFHIVNIVNIIKQSRSARKNGLI